MKIYKVSDTPTITASSAYTAGDAIGGLLEFENAASIYRGTGVIRKVIISDRAKQSAAINLWLFDQTFTAAVDHAAFTPSDADLDNCVGVVNILAANYFPAAASSVAVTSYQNPDFPFNLVEPYGSTLYGQLVAVGTPTYVATDDLTVTLIIER